MKILQLGLILTLSVVTLVSSAPQSTTPSWVSVSTDGQDAKNNESAQEDKDKVPKVPKISSLKVESNVTNRFATTLVTSKVKNLDKKSQEAAFEVVLPESAYISGFVMEIDGKKYEAYVQEKEEAKKTYENAVSSGIAAGHVAVNARDSNRFTVSVNIEPESKAIFYLTYEELLKREKGQYEVVINLRPGQLVKDMEVQVNINETRPLTFVRTPALRSGNEISKNDVNLEPNAEIDRIANNTAKVSFKPNEEKQKEFATKLGTEEVDGLAGQFVVQYDVERDPKGGEVLVSDGYFVHFFAPTDLKPLAKHVVFVLDTSGSMYGTRIEQLKEAMKSILSQLRKEDSFNIIDFDSGVQVWNIPKAEVQYKKDSHWYYQPDTTTPSTNETEQKLPGSFEVSEETLKKAENVVEKLEASGGTDIESALSIALRLLKENKASDERQPIIMFLTDGEPTSGETSTDKILSKITNENGDGTPIFSLSFGRGADRSFLEKMSLRNYGFARHIYEGSDAALQLESFYKYISSPLLNKVNFKYVSQNVSGLTKTSFPIFFDGSEIVVAGKFLPPSQIDPGFSQGPGSVIDPGFGFIPPVIECWAGPNPREFKPRIENPIGNLEKHWAYLTLQQILEQRDAADNKTELTKKALDIALKYSFVTPVSSLVVVKPNNTKAEANPEDAIDGPESGYGPISLQNSKVAYRPAYSFAAPAAPYPLSGGFPAPAASYPHFGAPVHNRITGGYSGSSILHMSSLQGNSPPYAFADNFAAPVFPSTTFAAHTTEQTSATTVSVEIEKIVETFNVLKGDLPWLENVFDSKNGNIKLTEGTYLLDSSITPGTIECTNTPQNGTGTCVLLKNCPQVYSSLKDLTTYENSFCKLNDKYAGVCCPEKPVEPKTN